MTYKIPSGLTFKEESSSIFSCYAVNISSVSSESVLVEFEEGQKAIVTPLDISIVPKPNPADSGFYGYFNRMSPGYKSRQSIRAANVFCDHLTGKYGQDVSDKVLLHMQFDVIKTNLKLKDLVNIDSKAQELALAVLKVKIVSSQDESSSMIVQEPSFLSDLISADDIEIRENSLSKLDEKNSCETKDRPTDLNIEI